MMRIAALFAAATVLALGATPYIALRAAQPLAWDMQSAYAMLPGGGLGLRLPQSENFALRTELAGAYGAGSGDYSALRLWDAGLRVSEEFNFSPLFDGYLGAGLIYVYASERRPSADTMGTIADKWYAGSGFGVVGNCGVALVKTGSIRLDMEAGFDLAGVRTSRRVEQWENPILSLASFNAGLVLRFGEQQSKPQDPRKPCTGCQY